MFVLQRGMESWCISPVFDRREGHPSQSKNAGRLRRGAQDVPGRRSALVQIESRRVNGSGRGLGRSGNASISCHAIRGSGIFRTTSKTGPVGRHGPLACTFLHTRVVHGRIMFSNVRNRGDMRLAALGGMRGVSGVVHSKGGSGAQHDQKCYDAESEHGCNIGWNLLCTSRAADFHVPVTLARTHSSPVSLPASGPGREYPDSQVGLSGSGLPAYDSSGHRSGRADSRAWYRLHAGS